VLTLDIENSPALAYVFGLFDQNIGLAQVEEPGQVISVAYKWFDEEEVHFVSDFHDGHDTMIRVLWGLLDEADIVVGYNSKNFDVKHLNREFFEAGLGPPSSYKHIDLLMVMRSQFKFLSNKLDYIVQRLGLGAKVIHEGMRLWIACMKGDPEAWERMKKYNKEDVVITERLYDRVRAWIPNHPHLGVYTGLNDVCPVCLAPTLEEIGFAVAQVTSYKEYRCSECAHVVKGRTKRELEPVLYKTSKPV